MKLFLCIVIGIISLQATAQTIRYNAALLDTLQQISTTNTPSKYFAKLYYQAIEKSNKRIAKQPENVQKFVIGFESLFAPTYFKSYKNYIEHKPQVFNWQNYYADTTLTELQYEFMGMNAHINGDMWLALKDKYPYDTLKKYKKPLIKFQKALDPFFDSIYNTTNQYKKIKRLHFFTVGLDKKLGRKMILHWRKRQIALALLWYSNPAKCQNKLRRLKKKMKKFDHFALKAMK